MADLTLRGPLEVRTFILWGSPEQKQFQVRRLKMLGWKSGLYLDKIEVAGSVELPFSREI